jgi:hypothetical protein
MTRLDRLLLHVPRLRQLVLDCEALAAHCARLQRERDESLERERALRQELETSTEEARALAAAAGGDRSILQRMRDDWDGRAISAPRCFIVSGEPLHGSPCTSRAQTAPSARKGYTIGAVWPGSGQRCFPISLPRHSPQTCSWAYMSG